MNELDQIRDATELWERGALDDDEFAALKAKIIAGGSTTSADDDPVAAPPSLGHGPRHGRWAPWLVGFGLLIGIGAVVELTLQKRDLVARPITAGAAARPGLKQIFATAFPNHVVTVPVPERGPTRFDISPATMIGTEDGSRFLVVTGENLDDTSHASGGILGIQKLDASGSRVGAPAWNTSSVNGFGSGPGVFVLRSLGGTPLLRVESGWTGQGITNEFATIYDFTAGAPREVLPMTMIENANEHDADGTKACATHSRLVSLERNRRVAFVFEGRTKRAPLVFDTRHGPWHRISGAALKEGEC